MKSIYKKISVGVLAAGLLVGGSGALQGGQAFAASNHKAVFGNDFDGLWDYSLIKDLNDKYQYQFEIESISKKEPSKVHGELEDRIDFMFLLKKGEQHIKGKKVSIKDVQEGEQIVLKIGKYYYQLKFIKVR